VVIERFRRLTLHLAELADVAWSIAASRNHPDLFVDAQRLTQMLGRTVGQPGERLGDTQGEQRLGTDDRIERLVRQSNHFLPELEGPLGLAVAARQPAQHGTQTVDDRKPHSLSTANARAIAVVASPMSPRSSATSLKLISNNPAVASSPSRRKVSMAVRSVVIEPARSPATYSCIREGSDEREVPRVACALGQHPASSFIARRTSGSEPMAAKCSDRS
jgi:hypothetical protein